MAASLQVTAKALPPAVRLLGVAVVPLVASVVYGPYGPPGPRFEDSDSSWIFVAVQAESEMVPVWPAVEVAAARLKLTVPKSVSGRTAVPPGVRVEGASAIHSAEEMSGAAILSVFVKLLPVVAFFSETVTAVPFTLTDAEMRSPAWIFRATFTEPAGRSSYQAE